MSNNAGTQDLRAIARRRVNARIGLYIHATVYVVVNAFLAFVQAQTSPQHYWSLWPAAGWGIGLAIHATVVLLAGSGVREQMEEAELRRLERRSPADR